MIKVENVSMKFRMNGDNIQSLKEFVIATAKKKTSYKDFWVFKDISFEVKKGEVVGIIGRNGAGKSTMLKIISGILTPTEGNVTLNGKVVPMLELGSGFDYELTGRENVFLNGSILGYSEEFLKEKYDEIVEFSELEEFMETPIRNYSSGMMMRLAFAIATIVQPEILIVDEILAVGDEAFQKKSKRKMLELMGGGTTVLFVSHSIAQIREMCNRVIWLEKGQVKMQGETKFVCDEYQKYINPVADDGDKKHKASDAPKNLSDVLFVYGDDEKAYEWRVTNQREQLLAGAIASNEIYDEDITEHLAKLYRVFICVRCRCSEQMQKFLECAKKYNKVVLFDINTCLDDVEKKETLIEQEKVFKTYARYCDGVIVSNENLKRKFSEMGYDVFENSLAANEKMVQYASWSTYDRDVLPYLNPEYLTEEELINYNRALSILRKRKSEGIRIGFFDGGLDSDAFLCVKDVIKKVLDNKKNSYLYIQTEELSLPEDMRDYQNRIIIKRQVDKEDICRIYAETDIIISAMTASDQMIDNTIEKAIYSAFVKVPFVVYGEQTNIDVIDEELYCQCKEKLEEVIRRLLEDKDFYEEKRNLAYQQVCENHRTSSTGDKIGQFLRRKMKPNMAFVLSNNVLWGGGVIALHHATLMQKQGYDVELIITGKEQYNIEYEGCSIPVVSRDLIYSYQYINKIIAMDADSVRWMQNYGNVGERYYLVQGYETNYYTDGARRLNINQMYTPHTMIKYITTSAWCQKWLHEKYKQESTLIKNGIDTGRFLGNEKKFSGKIKVLIIGNQCVDTENLQEAFEIAECLDRNRFEICYYAYGQVPCKNYRYDILYDQLEVKDMDRIFEECDILLQTCKNECFYTAPLKMMMAGGVVVACKDEANIEYFETQKNCILYETTQTEKAVQAIQKIADDSAFRTEIIKNGRETAKGYDWKFANEAIQKIYVS